MYHQYVNVFIFMYVFMHCIDVVVSFLKPSCRTEVAVVRRLVCGQGAAVLLFFEVYPSSAHFSVLVYTTAIYV